MQKFQHLPRNVGPAHRPIAYLPVNSRSSAASQRAPSPS
jgi:hypothetical protein